MDEELIADDLMPNDATYFAPEPDPVVERAINAEKAMVQAARPLFTHILAWFDDQIAQADSIDNITPMNVAGALSADQQILAMKYLKARLIRVKSDLEVMAQNHL